jgi:hypothetical protein
LSYRRQQQLFIRQQEEHMRVAFLLAAMLAPAVIAADASKPTSGAVPDLSGHWESARWGAVTLTRSSTGDGWVGTYSNTHSRKPGNVSLRYSPSTGHIEGTWSDGSLRFGRVTLRIADSKTIDGAYSAAKCELDPRTPKGEPFQWRRPAR